MDILIKNMEMPKSCEKCPLKCVVKSNPMIITNKGVSRLTKEKDCPLIPVPEHGDLIDRQKFYEKIVQHIKDTESEDFTDKEREMVQMAMKAVLYELLNECAVVLERTT